MIRMMRWRGDDDGAGDGDGDAAIVVELLIILNGVMAIMVMAVTVIV